MTAHLSVNARARQRGLSLVELMVGIAVGLFVVAGATVVVSAQLGDNRRLLLDTQLQQDLRASMDIVTREMRRSGSAADATALAGLWYPGTPAVVRNEQTRIEELVQDPGKIVFHYRRAGLDSTFGFQLANGALRSLLGPTWQELTDSTVMRVTAFSITPVPRAEPPVQLPCPTACSADPADTACWPTLQVRAYEVAISAQSLRDPSIRRDLRSEVRLRNDVLNFNDPLNPNRVCPG